MLPIEKFSFSIGSQVRHDGAIKGYGFVLGFSLMILKGFNPEYSGEKWASAIGKSNYKDGLFFIRVKNPGDFPNCPYFFTSN